MTMKMTWKSCPLHWPCKGSERSVLIPCKANEEDVSDRPALIILDYNMPGVNGQQMLALLKDNKAIQDIPVVMYSTSLSAVLIKNLSDAGAFECFKKPDSYKGIQVQTGIFKDLVNSFTINKNLA